MQNMSQSSNNKTKKLILPNPFNYSTRNSFMPFIKDVEGVELILDFTGVIHIDSSGLGLLLLARAAVGDIKISLLNCSDEIKQLLVMANFHILFKIT